MTLVENRSCCFTREGGIGVEIGVNLVEKRGCCLTGKGSIGVIRGRLYDISRSSTAVKSNKTTVLPELVISCAHALKRLHLVITEVSQVTWMP